MTSIACRRCGSLTAPGAICETCFLGPPEPTPLTPQEQAEANARAEKLHLEALDLLAEQRAAKGEPARPPAADARPWRRRRR